MTTTTTQEERLHLLQAATDAKIAYWDANRAFEQALGYTEMDIPDKVSDAIEEGISDLAAAGDASQIGAAELDYLLGKIGKARVLAAAEG